MKLLTSMIAVAGITASLSLAPADAVSWFSSNFTANEAPPAKYVTAPVGRGRIARSRRADTGILRP